MIKGKNDYLKLGDMNAVCDVCGFKYKMSQLRERWDGYLVCSEDWEPRHPRDFPRPARTERQPTKTSPEPVAVYEDVTYSQTPTVPSATMGANNVE